MGSSMKTSARSITLGRENRLNGQWIQHRSACSTELLPQWTYKSSKVPWIGSHQNSLASTRLQSGYDACREPCIIDGSRR